MRAWNLGWIAGAALVVATGCTVESTDDDGGGGDGAGAAGAGSPTGLPALGNASHDIGSMEVSFLAGSAEGLAVPRDIAFHPTVPGQAWLINNSDDSTVVVDDMGGASQNATRFASFGGNHFLANPSALAFGDNGNFATAQEEDQVTQPDTPTDFMGPTLWPSDLTIFDAGHSGHLDMLHNSPNAVGIAWESGNAYWVFDGFHSSITRYDFAEPHEPGGTDHSDGVIYRYVEGEVARVPGISSHMVYDHENSLLWIADTGNSRIAIMDPGPAERDGRLMPNYDGGIQYHYTGAEIRTFVDTTEHGFTQPSGLEIYDGHVYVSAADTATIYAFDIISGEMVDHLPLQTEPGSISGFAFDQAGNIVYADPLASAAIRLAPK